MTEPVKETTITVDELLARSVAKGRGAALDAARERLEARKAGMSDKQTTNERDPWDRRDTALWRLRQWRDGGDCPVSYTAGSDGFAEDVKALLDEAEELRQKLIEVRGYV